MVCGILQVEAYRPSWKSQVESARGQEGGLAPALSSCEYSLRVNHHRSRRQSLRSSLQGYSSRFVIRLNDRDRHATKGLSIICFEWFMANLAAVVDSGDRTSASQLKLNQVICMRYQGAVRINHFHGNE